MNFALPSDTPHVHEWLPETRYLVRRCKHCGAHPVEDAIRRLRQNAHIHVGDPSGNAQPVNTCYGSYEVCGEYHQHTLTCGSRNLICRRVEDRDAVALVDWIDAHMPAYKR